MWFNKSTTSSCLLYYSGHPYGVFNCIIGIFYKQVVPIGLPLRGILFIEI